MKYLWTEDTGAGLHSGSWSISFSLMMHLWSKVKKVIRAYWMRWRI